MVRYYLDPDLRLDRQVRRSLPLLFRRGSGKLQALSTAGIAPPAIELADTDLAAIRWADQPDIDWILLTPSLAAAHTQTVICPVAPRQLVPFTLQWNPSRAHTTAVARFVHCALAADLPPGWHTQPDHLHHAEPNQDPDGPPPEPAPRSGCDSGS